MVCPDEYPLLAFISLLGAAVARSNSVVIVPSQKCPVLALDMYQVIFCTFCLFLVSMSEQNLSKCCRYLILATCQEELSTF